MPDIILDIPPRVLGRVQHALATLHAWNDAIRSARRVEDRFGQRGRYEREYRDGAAGQQLAAQVEAAHATLATFETMAARHGLEAQAVYAALGGKPALIEEGPQVTVWRPGKEKTYDL